MKLTKSTSDVELTTQVQIVKRYKATKGHMLPLFYKGSIIHIGTLESVEIDESLLEYEPRHQFEKALRDKHIVVEGAE